MLILALLIISSTSSSSLFEGRLCAFNLPFVNWGLGTDTRCCSNSLIDSAKSTLMTGVFLNSGGFSVDAPKSVTIVRLRFGDSFDFSTAEILLLSLESLLLSYSITMSSLFPSTLCPA